MTSDISASFPVEMQCCFLSYLTPKDLFTASRVNKRWKCLAEEVREAVFTNYINASFDYAFSYLDLPKVDEAADSPIIRGEGVLQIRYERNVISGRFPPMPFSCSKPGTYQGVLSIDLKKGLIEDSIQNDPLLPKHGFKAEGVKKWIVRLLKGHEMTRLICISGVFQESYIREQTITLFNGFNSGSKKRVIDTVHN